MQYQIAFRINLFFLFFILGFCAFSQDKYSLGIKGGLNYATIAGDAEGIEPRLGYHIGFYGQGAISDMFSFGTELQFTSQGAQTTDDPIVKLKYDYLTLAFLLKVYPANQSRFSIQLGPQFGCLLKATEDDKDVRDKMNIADLSMVGGLGFNVTSRLEVVARYSYGIISTADTDDDKKLPNSVIQIGLAFALTKHQNASKE